PGDVASLARFADAKGMPLLAAYLRDAAALASERRGGAEPVPAAPTPSDDERRASVAEVPSPSAAPEEDEPEGWETIPSVRAPSERAAGPLVVAVFTDGTEVLGTPTAPNEPPLARSYTSQTVAEERARALGEGWDVIKRG